MFDTALTLNDLVFLAQGAAMTLARDRRLGRSAGTLLGIVFGVVRAAGRRLVWSAPLTFVLDIFRSVPLLIQLVLGNAFQAIAGLGLVALRRPPAWCCRSTPRPTAPRSCAAASRRCRPTTRRAGRDRSG